jgi:hypothetical protein
MNESQFNALSKHLEGVAPKIPLRWGKIQNDRTDSKLNIFGYRSFQELDKALEGLSVEEKNYFKKRWFIWRCSQCDEYLFYSQPGVRANPESRDQDWDVEFFGRKDWRFDIKGTLVPRSLRKVMTKGAFPVDPHELISFNFDNQSTGVRSHYQNRIFLVHVPYTPKNENALRANFKAKKSTIEFYLQNLQQHPTYKFIDYKGLKCDVIFLCEDSRGRVFPSFGSNEESCQ